MSLESGLDKGFTTSFRDFFDNFLWARDTTKEVQLTDIGMKLTPNGKVDMSNGVDNVRFGLGDMVKFKLPSGMRCVMLMTRLGAVGLYEFVPDPTQPARLNLNILQSTKLARHRFIRKLEGNDAILEQLLLTFGYPERGIINLHEQIEELARDLAEAGQGT